MPDIVVFATVDDLSARTGKEYDADQHAQVQTLLADASAVLVGLGFPADETDPTRLQLAKMAVCNAVGYKIDRDAAFDAITQATQTAGPYTQSVTFATPSGSLRFLRQDLRALGLGSRYRCIQAETADLRCPPWLA